MIRLFSATLLSLLLCASLANAAEKPLIVASDATWPPIEMLDENKNVVGYSIDYLKAVAKEAGLNIENMVNKSKKNMAYTMLDATGAVDGRLAEKLAAIPAVIRVRIL